MNKKICSLVLVLLFVNSIASAFIAPKAKVTAKVVDENGEAINGANVKIAFMINKKSGWGMDDFIVEGKSDKDGFFTAKGQGAPIVGITVDMKEFYQSNTSYNFKERNFLNRWEPWNPTVEMILKKKHNPVPMYRTGTGWVTVPVVGEKVGYDLEKGDWVSPYGKGIVNDFIFLFQGDIKSSREYDLSMELEFSNEEDGIQEYFFNTEEQSYYKWPFEALEEGYQSSLIKETHKIPGKKISNRKKNVNYIFRVRTKVDKEGNIISAKYGKVPGEFDLSPDGTNYKFRFTYFFNPDGTRNLEEDPDQNLFKKK